MCAAQWVRFFFFFAVLKGTSIDCGGPELSVLNAKHKASVKFSTTKQSSRDRPPGFAGFGPGLFGYPPEKNMTCTHGYLKRGIEKESDSGPMKMFSCHRCSSHSACPDVPIENTDKFNPGSNGANGGHQEKQPCCQREGQHQCGAFEN